MNMFNYIFKILWLSLTVFILFLDRENLYMVVIAIILLVVLTIVTIFRSLDSRNQWRKLIKDGDVEIQDRIKF